MPQTVKGSVVESDNTTIKIGDLVCIIPWDCEGIEQPYGHLIFEKKYWHPEKQMTMENFRKKTKITPGSKALVTGREEVTGTHSNQIFYWCLVESKQLIVSHRFIEPV